MELETVVLENNEMDLGDFQQIYDGYSRAMGAFQVKLSEYKTLLDELKSRRGKHVSNLERQRLDSLAEETEIIHREYLKMKGMISSSLENLLFECKDLEGFLNYHSSNPDEDARTGQARSWIEEAMEMRDRDNPLRAVELTCMAKDCLTTMLDEADNAWLKIHEEKARSIMKD